MRPPRSALLMIGAPLALICALVYWGRVGRSGTAIEPAVPAWHEQDLESGDLDRGVQSRSSVVRTQAARPAGELWAQGMESGEYSDTHIRGHVVDDQGTPISHFSLVLQPEDSAASDDYSITTIENAQGAFEIARRGSEHAAVFAQVGRIRRSKTVSVSTLGPSEAITLMVSRCGSIVGHVLTEQGYPIQGATIRLAFEGDSLPPVHQLLVGVQASAVSNRDGGFDIQDVRSGSVTLVASSEQFSDSRREVLLVNPGVTATSDLRLVAGGRVVGVAMQTRDGQPQEIGMCSARGNQGWQVTKCSANGVFEFENVLPQEYVIETRHAQSELDPTSVVGVRKQIIVRNNETTTVNFDMGDAPIHVAGSVRGGSTSPEGVNIEAVTQSGSEFRAIVSRDGTYGIDVDMLGQIEFTLSTKPYSYLKYTVSITSSNAQHVDFQLPAGTIRGRIVAPSGKPCAFAAVSCVCESNSGDGAHYCRTHTNDEGQFEFALLVPGEYVIRSPDGYWMDDPPPRTPFGGVVVRGVQVSAVPGEMINIRLQPEGRINVHVIDGEGKPIGGSTVQVFDSSGIARYAKSELRTDRTGRVLLNSIAPGLYTIQATFRALTGSSQPIFIQERATTALEIILK